VGDSVVLPGLFPACVGACCGVAERRTSLGVRPFPKSHFS